MNCSICGYQYDPTLGDPENGIPAGTAWEDIDEHWLCPDCQMPKDDFEQAII
ncbi:MAG TPA: rubredoxin [Pseudomonas sp.]|nr:rubredoxin [Pseudomonas sp.]